MARSIDAIFQEMVAAKESEVALSSLTSQSATALWRLLFYVQAVAIWTLEKLFDVYREEVDTRIGEIIPHRPKWYRDKVLDFMKDKVLATDTDIYDTTGMDEDDIAAAKVVKHAVATENDDASILTIKVAGEKDGVRGRLDDDTETQLAAYLAEIKDAGVRISLVNKNPDTYNCRVDIYYDPILLPENVKADCEEAIKAYVENLPFNGEYTNMALIDVVQTVEGVRIAELKEATTSADGESVITTVNARYVPVAGYFKTGTLTITMLPYE